MEHTWDVEEINGVSLVSCHLHNDEGVTCRVTVRSRLDGPVFPPRRRGRPEPGWTDGGITVRLDPGVRRAVGFAAAAEPIEPPITLEVDVDPEQCDPIGSDGAESTPAGSKNVIPTATREDDAPETRALRELGTHRPPRDALTTAQRMSETDDGLTDDHTPTSNSYSYESQRNGDTNTESIAQPSDPDRAADPDPLKRDPPLQEPPLQEPPLQEPPMEESPTREPSHLNDWFATIERRIERGERIRRADVATATDVIAAAGGVQQIMVLDDQLEADAEQLRQISDRATELARRAETTTIPTDALRTLS